MARSAGGGARLAIANRDRARRQVRREASALLRPWSPDSRPGTLPRRAGEEAGRDAGIDTAGTMAESRTMAGVHGPDLEETRTTPWTGRRNKGDDFAGARRPQ